MDVLQVKDQVDKAVRDRARMTIVFALPGAATCVGWWAQHARQIGDRIGDRIRDRIGNRTGDRIGGQMGTG